MDDVRVVLASQSPARLHELRRVGIEPEVIVSGVDESQVRDTDPRTLVGKLAELKAGAVREQLATEAEPTVLIACDSMLEFNGHAYGKSGTREDAAERWRAMRSHEGILHTGHHVAVLDGTRSRAETRVGSTVVTFADLLDDEIDAYVASGEPEHVAGGFTIDGYGGAFITGVRGDPHNVVGISLPLVRQMLYDMGITWHELWNR